MVVTSLFLMTGEAAALAAKTALRRNWVRMLDERDEKSRTLESLGERALNCLNT